MSVSGVDHEDERKRTTVEVSKAYWVSRRGDPPNAWQARQTDTDIFQMLDCLNRPQAQ